jgi:hypothetical protein
LVHHIFTPACREAIATDPSVLKALAWGYETAIGGRIVGMDSAAEVGDRFREGAGTLQERTNSLIRWQGARSGACGFFFSLGGPAAMLTVPLSAALVTFVQLRMIAAIAHMGDHDIESEQVRTFAYACLCGNGFHTLMKDTGVAVGARLSALAYRNVSQKGMKRISEAVASRLGTEWASHGLLAVGKAAPLAGACFAAYLEARSTAAVGRVARDLFIP